MSHLHRSLNNTSTQGAEWPLPLASEVIREGLRLLKEKEEVHQSKLQELRREIQIGIDQANKGQVSAFMRKRSRKSKPKDANGWRLTEG